MKVKFVMEHKKDKNLALINKIKNILQREDTILFMGSGISCWSNLPSWTSLVKQLAKFMENEGYDSEPVLKEMSSNLLVAASIGVNQLSKSAFKTFMRSACRVGQAKPHEIHRKISNLGARCYVTTNYDQLLEATLRKYRSDYHFQVITNKQPTDCATIMQVREKDFIFKLHGDIDDTESIVLTHEQYRELYGDKSYTLKTLETLLLTRTAVFLGFGLKDPDFLSIKDTIENTFKGSTCTHYAIMSDMSEEEKQYWFKNFGIQILSYDTKKLDNNMYDHSQLLDILDSLSNEECFDKNEGQESITGSVFNDILNDTQILSILRYVSALNFKLNFENNIEFPLTVIDMQKFKYYRNLSVNHLLRNSNNNLILIGNPGAGKSYSLKKYCNELSYNMRDLCIKGVSDITSLHIPLYIDLKHYSGSIWKMAEEQFAKGTSLELLVSKGAIVFVIDSFNEMPKEYFENGLYEKDISDFLNTIKKCRVIIGSRTDEGLRQFKYSIYKLEEIDSDFIIEYFKVNEVKFDDIFKFEILSLLQKPLFFKLLCDKKIKVKNDSTPKKIYDSFFDNLNKDFLNQYGYKIDFIDMLKSIAYIAIDEGKEAFSYMEIHTHIKQWLNMSPHISIDARTVINWLIEFQQFLIPAPKMRLSFFHQSITEYLAALEFANLYRSSPNQLARCLKFTRWDQTLFLALGFLNDKESSEFIKYILEIDIKLAIRASKYVEYKGEEIVNKILEYIISHSKFGNYDFNYDIANVVTNLPVTEQHLPKLRILLNQHNTLGGAAAKLMERIYGYQVKEELLNEMFSNVYDYNYLQDLGDILSKYVSEKECIDIIHKLKHIRCDNLEAITAGFSKLLKNHSIEVLINGFKPYEDLNKIQQGVLCDLLHDEKSKLSLEICADLIKLKIREAVFSMYLIIKYGEVEFNASLFDGNLIDSIEILYTDTNYGKWAVSLMETSCKLSIEIADKINNRVSKAKDETKLIYLYCLRDRYKDKFWSEYFRFIESKVERYDFIEGFDDLEWNSQGITMVELIIKLRDVDLLYSFLNSIREIDICLNISFETVKSLLDWIYTNIESFQNKNDGFTLYLLGEFITKHTDEKVRNKIIKLFNDAACTYRSFLGQYVLRNMNELKVEDISDDAIGYLIRKLYKEDGYDNLLLHISSESFVEEYLIPLLSKDEEPLKTNLQVVLDSLGKQHMRRYNVF